MNSFEHLSPHMTRAELTALPNDAKQYFYKQLQVRHDKLSKIAYDAMQLLSRYNETSILALIGSTGVGKTTLSRRLLSSLIENAQDDPQDAGSTVPFIFISAPANGDRSMSWTSLYEKILSRSNEILITRKHSNNIKDGKISISTSSARHRNLSALRDSLESMFKHRKVNVLVIDEAYHMLRFGNYTAVMDTLKSLADETGVKLLLLGSYDLFELVTDYGQVARRAEILHFQRYRREIPEDCLEFERIIARFQERWPCDEVPNFTSIHFELMEASLGCLGLLKSFLLEALAMQIANNGRWDIKILMRAAKSMKLLNRIRIEIEAGEQKLEGATYGESIFSGQLLTDANRKMRGH